MRFFLLFILIISCTSSNYGVHEMNLREQQIRMITHDSNMKKRMTKARKRGIRSYSKSKNNKTIKPIRKLI